MPDANQPPAQDPSQTQTPPVEPAAPAAPPAGASMADMTTPAAVVPFPEWFAKENPGLVKKHNGDVNQALKAYLGHEKAGTAMRAAAQQKPEEYDIKDVAPQGVEVAEELFKELREQGFSKKQAEFMLGKMGGYAKTVAEQQLNAEIASTAEFFGFRRPGEAMSESMKQLTLTRLAEMEQLALAQGLSVETVRAAMQNAAGVKNLQHTLSASARQAQMPQGNSAPPSPMTQHEINMEFAKIQSDPRWLMPGPIGEAYRAEAVEKQKQLLSKAP